MDETWQDFSMLIAPRHADVYQSRMAHVNSRLSDLLGMAIIVPNLPDGASILCNTHRLAAPTDSHKNSWIDGSRNVVHGRLFKSNFNTIGRKLYPRFLMTMPPPFVRAATLLHYKRFGPHLVSLSHVPGKGETARVV
jgi:hypothetical protein